MKTYLRDYPGLSACLPQEKKDFHQDCKQLLQATLRELHQASLTETEIYSIQAGRAISGEIYLQAINPQTKYNDREKVYLRGVECHFIATPCDPQNPRDDGLRIIARQTIYQYHPQSETYLKTQNGDNHHVSPENGLNAFSLSKWLLEIYRSGKSTGHYQSLLNPFDFKIGQKLLLPRIGERRPQQLLLFQD